jgi:VCBS repeat-containing protein
MPQSPAVLDLSSLDGSNGFKINLETPLMASVRVASAGDVNSDGFEDIIIGALNEGHFSSGSSYVLYGTASGFSAEFDLSTINGTNGFRLDGSEAEDVSGAWVASAGDFNADGFGDVLVGAPGTGDHAGSIYTIFGRGSGLPASLSFDNLDGSNGFRIDGDDFAFASISMCTSGDVNGDGFSDVIIARPWGAPFFVFNPGSIYVVFGAPSPDAASMGVTDLNGDNGFRIDGIVSLDGHIVSALEGNIASADVNGDGFSDLIFGASGAWPYYEDKIYVVYGQASGFGSSFDLATLDGTNGFQISGGFFYRFGSSVASADVNGDDFADLIIGAPGATAGRSIFVIFGSETAPPNSLGIWDLDGSNGFRIDGADSSPISTLASAGDFNGDGFSDILIGAPDADPNGNSSGSTYVVYGKASGFGATLNLSTLDGTNGFRIDGAEAGDYSGSAINSAGDINSDGFDDLIIGAIGHDFEHSSAAYVIFGHSSTNSAPIAVSDTKVTQKGATVSVAAAQGVLANDTDPDGDHLQVGAVNGSSDNVGASIAGAYGTLTLNADGSYQYVAKPKIPLTQNPADIFSYTTSDGHGGVASASLVITISKGSSNEVALPFAGDFPVTQGPNDTQYGDHTKFMKWSYDFSTSVGTNVLAVGNGTVVDVREYIPDGSASSMKFNKQGKLVPDPKDVSNGTGNFGNYVTILLDDGTYVTYMHLAQNGAYVSVGQPITVGDPIGIVGLTGARTGAHLHIQFGTEEYHSESIKADIKAGGADAINGVKNIIAGGSGNVLPKYFAHLTVQLDGPNNVYNASPGAELFSFEQLAGGGYTIDAFQHGADKIDLSALDANVGISGNQSFGFGGESAIAVSNSVIWHEASGNTIIQADVNGDKGADFTLTLVGVNQRLSATDFLL